MRAELTTGVKRRLGLKPGDRLPVDAQEVLDAAVHELAENAVATAIFQEVAKLGPRALSVNSGSGSAGVRSDQALLHDAERLAAKRKALRIAGFSNDEAMRLLVAEANGLAAQPHPH